MTSVEVRKRVRTTPPPPPEVRKRVRSSDPVEAPEAPEVLPDAIPSPRYARRLYGAQDAEELAGTPEDPVARGIYSNAAILQVDVHSDGPGDKTVGKLWKRDDGKFHVWGITPEGRLKYRGLQAGKFQEVADRLHAGCRSIAIARSRMKNPPIHYAEYKTK